MESLDARTPKVSKKAKRPMLAAIMLLAALVGVPKLSGQEASWSKWNRGLQLGTMMATGKGTNLYEDPYFYDYDLEVREQTRNGTGIGMAWYSEKVWSNGWALRGRLEFTYLLEKVEIVSQRKECEWGHMEQRNQARIKTFQIGAMLDCIYYSRNSNLYPFIGFGYFSRLNSLTTGIVRIDTEWGRTENGFGSDWDPNSSASAISIGGGWNFTNHLGLEVKYSICKFSWAQASILYRF